MEPQLVSIDGLVCIGEPFFRLMKLSSEILMVTDHCTFNSKQAQCTYESSSPPPREHLGAPNIVCQFQVMPFVGQTRASIFWHTERNVGVFTLLASLKKPALCLQHLTSFIAWIVVAEYMRGSYVLLFKVSEQTRADRKSSVRLIMHKHATSRAHHACARAAAPELLKLRLQTQPDMTARFN